MIKGLEYLSYEDGLRGRTLHSGEDSWDVYKYLMGRNGDEGTDSSP